jgi:hypothetical protein
MSRYFGELASIAFLAPLGGYGTSARPSRAMTPDATALPMSVPIRHVHRDRDAAFGIGYGNSSGYGTDRRYVADWSPQRFRCI